MTDDNYRRPNDPAAQLSELRGGKRPAASTLPEAEETEPAEGESYSMRSAGRRQKIMLELRFKTGDAIALAYSYLVRADLDPSKGIVLDFSAYDVRIEGRNLRPLFTGIVAQLVGVIPEQDDLQAEATAERDGTVATLIEVKAKDENRP